MLVILSGETDDVCFCGEAAAFAIKTKGIMRNRASGSLPAGEGLAIRVSARRSVTE